MSNINTNSIDTNYPVPGQNNSSQGFRDNFTGIKINLNAAAEEISDIQTKAVVKSALVGTSLNNDMANTLISNASVRSFRATTYNIGSNLPSTVLINTSLADVQYGVITQNTAISFGGWAPAGTQSNVTLHLTIANANAYVSFPNTTVNPAGTITQGMTATARLLENFYSNVGSFTPNITYTNTVSSPAGVNELKYVISTTDCGTTLDILPVNRNQRASQIPARQPAATGLLGDAPGQICTDGAFLYVCVGTYNGTSPIWGKIALSAVT
jgi:hypothetical protein